MRVRLPALLIGAILLFAGPAYAERTDELVLWNGNTITGEVKSLQQGKLKFKTDHAGTIYIEWEFINSVTSTTFFEVGNQQGEFFYGMLSAGPEERKLVVIGPTQTVVLDMEQVVEIMPIRKTFWGKVDGSLNLGFSFTSADNILQYSIESDATYRQRKYSAKITLSSIQTRIEIEQEDRETTFRDNLDFTYTRYLKNRNFVSGSLDFTRSSELGIDLRAEIGWALGRTFVQSIRTRLGCQPRRVSQSAARHRSARNRAITSSRPQFLAVTNSFSTTIQRPTSPSTSVPFLASPTGPECGSISTGH